MHLDSTKDKIYIHDLDAELADIDASAAQPPLIFIPDIERHLNQLPELLLRGGGGGGADAAYQRQPSGGELVLYGVPSSLSVPAERDSVRRAILEARARAREKQGREQMSETEPAGTSREADRNDAYEHDGDDDDAMDLE